MKNYRLYLIRHGLTTANTERFYAGSGTDVELCSDGISQLHELKELFEYPRVNTVFSSPMKRAVETSEILFPDAKNKIVLDVLTENNFGEFEGKKMDELKSNDHFNKWINPNERYTPIGAESAIDFNTRTQQAFLQIFEYMIKAQIYEAACVTHGGVIMSMLSAHAMPKRLPEQWMADAGCGYAIMTSAEMIMRDKIGEAYEIIPRGYFRDE
ncbi:MAG: histidine phosphatase family protein [Oscillospiraceae bacterium]